MDSDSPKPFKQIETWSILGPGWTLPATVEMVQHDIARISPAHIPMLDRQAAVLSKTIETVAFGRDQDGWLAPRAALMTIGVPDHRDPEDIVRWGGVEAARQLNGMGGFYCQMVDAGMASTIVAAEIIMTMLCGLMTKWIEEDHVLDVGFGTLQRFPFRQNWLHVMQEADQNASQDRFYGRRHVPAANNTAVMSRQPQRYLDGKVLGVQPDQTIQWTISFASSRWWRRQSAEAESKQSGRPQLYAARVAMLLRRFSESATLRYRDYLAEITTPHGLLVARPGGRPGLRVRAGPPPGDVAVAPQWHRGEIRAGVEVAVEVSHEGVLAMPNLLPPEQDLRKRNQVAESPDRDGGNDGVWMLDAIESSGSSG